MKNSSTPAPPTGAQQRRGERGAALITMLLISALLLAAGGTLIVTTGMSALNSIDTVPEAQAYYAAEAGLEATLNVLRGHVQPNPLFNGTVSHDANKIDFQRAINVATSNRNTTAEQAAPPRLSRWLSYNYTPAGAAIPDRVVLSPDPANPGSYSPMNGTAYSVRLSDPDNSQTVTLSSTGIFESTGTDTLSVDVAGLSVGIRYEPQGVATMTALSPTAVTLGNFRLTLVGGAAGLINIPTNTRFRLRVTQTAPWAAVATLSGTLTGSIGLTGSTLQLTFDRLGVITNGTTVNLTVPSPLPLPLGLTPVTANITAPQPQRLSVQAIGYGPRGARKRLEMILNRSAFDFEAPASLTLRGSADCSAHVVFDSGASGAKTYSGFDSSGLEPVRPAFATTRCDVASVEAGINKHDTVDDPEIGVLDNLTPPTGVTTTSPTVPVSTPSFLESADEARRYLNGLEALARSMGRYFQPASGSSRTVNEGTLTAPVLNFVDGDCELDGGAGILIVTGTLRMHGNPNFNGIILVLGEGRVERSGGGNGDLLGAMVVAKFDRTGTGDFGAPYFDTAGGGNSTLQYDSVSVNRAMGALGSRVAGVREY